MVNLSMKMLFLLCGHWGGQWAIIGGILMLMAEILHKYTPPWF